MDSCARNSGTYDRHSQTETFTTKRKRVQKVYGDSSVSAANFAKVQNDILGPAVLRISRKFAEHQTVILETMGTWAAAGKQGKELAAITEETLRVATLGEIDLTKATGFLTSRMA